MISNAFKGDKKRDFSRFFYQALVFVFLLALLAPLWMLLLKALSAPSPIFRHLWDTVLLNYVANSVFLLFGVCFLSMFWGISVAWFVARYDFPWRGFFRWALLLPMAMPAYLAAFYYTNLFDYAGVVQSTIRRVFGFSSPLDYYFFNIRSLGGAMFVLSLVFMPYVYWIVSLSFARLPESVVCSAYTLGAREWRLFWRIALPAARPFIAVACALVAMETLADFGTVAYFSVWNLTTGIYDVWLAHRDVSAAAKLSALMLLFVLFFLGVEKYQRRNLRATHVHSAPYPRQFLSKKGAFFVWLWCFLVLLFSFMLPALWLLNAAWRYMFDTDWQAFLKMAYNSFKVSLLVALAAVVIALVLQVMVRFDRRYQWLLRLASSGYAVPGTVLALGVLLVTTGVDHSLNRWLMASGGERVGLIFSGTLFAMAYAFLCRFSAVSIGSVESGFSRIPVSLDESVYVLGGGRFRLATRVWLPLLRSSLLTAVLLVFLESMKELSAAMLLRPFNVEMLATYIYEYMSTERFEAAALPALLLVITGLPMVFLLLLRMREDK